MTVFAVKFTCQTCRQQNEETHDYNFSKWKTCEYESLTLAMDHLKRKPTHNVVATVDVEIRI